jgi:hypothetical protein
MTSNKSKRAEHVGSARFSQALFFPESKDGTGQKRNIRPVLSVFTCSIHQL